MHRIVNFFVLGMEDMDSMAIRDAPIANICSSCQLVYNFSRLAVYLQFARNTLPSRYQSVTAHRK